MGINKQSYDAITSLITKIDNISEKSLIELGIQESYFNSDFKFLRNKLSNLFFSYISLDLHNVEGVTIYDLSEYSPNKFSADIITNIGTSEHVEYENGQYNCWKNMHSWLKKDGIFVHEIPEVGSWKDHCRYYCDFEFFNNFTNYGYEILELNHHYHPGQGNLIWCVLKKTEMIDFMTQEEFYSKMTIDKSVTSENIDYRNNPKNLKII
jgi:hypothetical protein